MVATSDRHVMSPEVFLAWEGRQQAWKHEYLNGEAYAMAGGMIFLLT